MRVVMSLICIGNDKLISNGMWTRQENQNHAKRGQLNLQPFVKLTALAYYNIILLATGTCQACQGFCRLARDFCTLPY